MKGFKIFAAFLVFRILSVFIVRTWYVPDEYWQSLEVGHKLAFGYGYLTWEWSKGIRSYFHPMLIALMYKGLELIKLDQVELLILVPRIFQAILTAFADYRFYKWCNHSKWSLFMITTAWFWFYTGSRTLANTLEATITTIALSYFPWNSESTVFIWFVSLVCFVRPTAAIQWLPLCLRHIKNSKFSVIEMLLKRYLLIGLTVGAIAVGIDTFAHGKFIITPVEFFKVNVLQEIGSFYGSHPWYWYFTSGLSTVLGVSTVPFLLATIETIRYRQVFPERAILLVSITFTLVVYSLLPHKEFRFVLPLLPMCLYICADFLSRWSREASTITLWLVAIGLLVGNVVPAMYLSFVHQKGTIEVMPLLAKISREYKDENGHRAKIMFLMPCHSTPYYSHIHENVTMRFLTCEPNFNKNKNYVDETSKFYKDPSGWIRSHIPYYPVSAMPTHLILFDNIAPNITEFLLNYKQLYSIAHTEVTFDRIGKNVLVYRRIDQNEEKSPQLDINKPTKIENQPSTNELNEF